jgi:hypothetical protein
MATSKVFKLLPSRYSVVKFLVFWKVLADKFVILQLDINKFSKVGTSRKGLSVGT